MAIVILRIEQRMEDSSPRSGAELVVATLGLSERTRVAPIYPSELRVGSERIRAVQTLSGRDAAIPSYYRAQRVRADRFSLSHQFIESSQYWVLQWAHPSLIMASDEGCTHHQEFKQEE